MGEGVGTGEAGLGTSAGVGEGERTGEAGPGTGAGELPEQVRDIWVMMFVLKA